MHEGIEGAILRAKRGRSRAWLYMSSGRYTQSDSRGGRTDMVQVPVRVYYMGGAHWCNLANTIEPFVRCDDATLCQITLTTC